MTGAPTVAVATTTLRVLPTRTELQSQLVHGYRPAFRLAESGPSLMLVHGIGDSSATWFHVLPALARRHTVIAQAR
ncbi:MAG: hypothetical protein L0I24_18435 [Pseudonocardia sp.]|nr:hypothetical protein [Pseudonocardia sp.]